MTSVTSVTMIDETAAGQLTPAVTLTVPEPQLTARELIRRRVAREVELHNAAEMSGTARFRGLVQPTETETLLNGALRDGERGGGSARRVDADKQIQTALRAFERNGFLMFVGDRQVEDLDEVVDLAGDAQVTFLKLTALVGG